MLDWIRNFNKNYSNIVFLVIMIFILISLVFVSITNRNKPKECIMPTKVVGESLAYSYSIKVASNNEDVAKIYVKRYDSKYLFEVNKDDTKNTYYLHYSDFLKRNSNGKYSIFVPNEIIKDINNKYYILDYINSLSMNSDVITKNERTCYVNSNENILICINLDNSIEIEKNGYTLTYTLLEKYINNFDVSVENIELPKCDVNTSE